MATKFNREAFMASPFMRALTDSSALSASEIKAADRDYRENVRRRNWDASRRAEIAYYKAKYHSELYAHARATLYAWKPGDPRTADMVGDQIIASAELISIMKEWAAYPKLAADQKKIFIACARRFADGLGDDLACTTYSELCADWLKAMN